MISRLPDTPLRDLGDKPPERNDPCYCGSGKKYKKCHLDADHEAMRAFQDVLPELRERQAREAVMKAKLANDYATYINFALPATWEGGKAWAIGSRLYPNRSANETFHEFLVSLARQTFTEGWRKEQAELPDDQQHFFLKASNEWAIFKAANASSVSWTAAIVIVAAVGFCTPLVNAPLMGVLTVRTPEALRPKVLTAVLTVSSLAGPLGFVVAGEALRLVPLSTFFFVLPALILLGSLTFAGVVLRRGAGEDALALSGIEPATPVGL
jgi:uncharacterized protein (DUF2267 family)